MCSYVKDTSTFSDTSHYMQADARSPRNKFHVPVECDHNARTGAHNLPSDTPGLPHRNRWFHHFHSSRQDYIDSRTQR